MVRRVADWGKRRKRDGKVERGREREREQGGDNAKEGMHAHVHNVFSYVGVPVTHVRIQWRTYVECTVVAYFA